MADNRKSPPESFWQDFKEGFTRPVSTLKEEIVYRIGELKGGKK